MRLGADVELIDKGYMLYNPLATNFFIHPLDHAESDRLGAFAEWRGGLGPVEVELGARLDRHGAETGAPRFGPGVPLGPANLALAFANADRDWSGTTFDTSLRLWADFGAITPRLTLARKTRAPSLIERFSWLPTEASGGLADGNIYVGSPSLKAEKAWVAEAGFDWSSAIAYGHWLVRDGLRLDFGIENLFDRYYLEHLAGYNRISGSNVPLGMRLPGSGRSAFVKLRWAVR